MQHTISYYPKEFKKLTYSMKLNITLTFVYFFLKLSIIVV